MAADPTGTPASSVPVPRSYDGGGRENSSERGYSLLEDDPALDRPAYRTGGRDLLEACELGRREAAGDVDRDVGAPRSRRVVVLDVDGHVSHVPLLRACVHH